MITAARILVLLLGLAICAGSIWGSVLPPRLIGIVRSVAERRWGIYFAAVIRILLGGALILVAPVSRFPLAIAVLGWVALAAGVGILLIGRARLIAFIAWFERLPPILWRIGLVFGLAFGAFLIYGVL